MEWEEIAKEHVYNPNRYTAQVQLFS
uniref:Uncharacterized protein n=1 Tax=Arundo donax TaxID=35708 RepID=A0A0A8YYV1_ARUDO